MESKARAVSSRPRKRSFKLKIFILAVIKILFVFGTIACFIAVGLVGGAVYGFIKTTPPITDDQLQIDKLTSFVYDKDNVEIGQLKGSENKNRILVLDKEVPKYLKDAFVSIEDERFYTHKGIDFIRISSAAYNFIKPGGSTHGGSTITQQVIKNITGDDQRTLKRKIQEQWRAMQLERHLAKWQILQLYMNLIYMGNGCYGVQSASNMYFNKDVSELSLSQCASLAGITNLPGRYDPFAESGKQKNIERKNIILDKMLQLGFINKDEHDKAINEDPKFAQKAEAKIVSSQSYFVDQVVTEVKKDLMAKGYSEQVALTTIYNHGLKIYSTMDSNVQKCMDEVFTDDKNFPVANKNAEHPEAAMVIVDPYTGQVRALYGGYGEKKGNTLNMATQIARQPGSSFKPIAVYGPALNERVITAASLYDDVAVYMDNQNKGKLYPQNYDKTYGGLGLIRDAIRKSTNVVAAKVYSDLGPKTSNKYLSLLNLNREDEPYISTALGGLKDGVSPLQMAAAYTPFVNKGIYNEPITYTKVVDKDGKVILEKKPKTNIVYEEGAAFIINSMLQDVCIAGTASAHGVLQNGNMPTGGKTGTTSDNKDKWFVGFTPHYTAATWYGYRNSSVIPQSEYDQALSLWYKVMEKVHSGLEPVQFTQPSNVIGKDVCLRSGKTPTELCRQDPEKVAAGVPGEAIRYEYFIKGTEPSDSDTCDIHVSAKVCTDSADSSGRNPLASKFCPPPSIINKVFLKRSTPYQEPAPRDCIYQLPWETCTVHGTGTSATIQTTPEPSTTPKATITSSSRRRPVASAKEKRN